MAQLRIYKCEKCGYTVRTEPQGFYGLMSGMYYNFKCSNCKRIIKLGLSGKGILPNCPYILFLAGNPGNHFIKIQSQFRPSPAENRP